MLFNCSINCSEFNILSRFKKLNSALWRNKTTPHLIAGTEVTKHSTEDHSETFSIPAQHAIRDINSALSTAPAATKSFTVYTGTKSDPNDVKSVNGGILHVPGFTSTSHVLDVAAGFSRHLPDGNGGHVKHVLEIHVSPGQHVGGDISHISGLPQEREFLMKPNQVLKLHPGHSVYQRNGDTFHIHKATVLDQHEIDNLPNNPEIKSHKNMSTHIGQFNKNGQSLPPPLPISESKTEKVITNFEMGISHKKKVLFEDLIYEYVINK